MPSGSHHPGRPSALCRRRNSRRVFRPKGLETEVGIVAVVLFELYQRVVTIRPQQFVETQFVGCGGVETEDTLPRSPATSTNARLAAQRAAASTRSLVGVGDRLLPPI